MIPTCTALTMQLRNGSARSNTGRIALEIQKAFGHLLTWVLGMTIAIVKIEEREWISLVLEGIQIFLDPLNPGVSRNVTKALICSSYLCRFQNQYACSGTVSRVAWQDIRGLDWHSSMSRMPVLPRLAQESIGIGVKELRKLLTKRINGYLNLWLVECMPALIDDLANRILYGASSVCFNYFNKLYP